MKKTVIKTLGPEGSSSYRAATSYIALNCVENTSLIILYETFTKALKALKYNELFLVPSAYNGIHNFFFDQHLYLKEYFIDRSSVYFMCSGSINPNKNILYIHPATRALVDDFLKEKDLHLEIIEVKSSSLAAIKCIEDNCYSISNQSAVEYYNLIKINDGYNFSMSWNIFTKLKKED